LVEEWSDVGDGDVWAVPIGSTADWAEAACTPSGAAGLLARVGPVVLVTGPAPDDELAPILDHAQMVAANGGDGRQLMRGFAVQLSTLGHDPPSFVAAAPVDRGLAIFAVGEGCAEIDGQEFSGRESLAWVEEVVPWPIRRVALYVGGPRSPGSGLHDLRDGVVSAAGCILVSAASSSRPGDADAAESASAVGQPELEPQDMGRHWAADDDVESTGPISIPGPPVARRPVFTPAPGESEKFESILIGLGSFEPDSIPTPLPVVEKPGRSRVVDESAPVVKGVFCKRGHFNDPRMLFCAVCGINMVQQTPVRVDGARPPLGVIVLDDGAVFQLDADYLLGREPDADERVRHGKWRAIPLADNQNAISRVHARIELRQWDVVLVDDNSTNGTFYADPTVAQWVPVPRGGEQILQPGWRIRVGHRTLAFNTHRG
jgi:FHA domain